MTTDESAGAAQDDWTGPRPLASGAPLLIVAALALVLMVVLAAALRREVAIPAEVASHYVDLMAGTLAPDIEAGDGDALARLLGTASLGFTPRVRELAPEFRLVGGRVHRIAERPAAVWVYRDGRSEMLLAEAFAGTLDDLGPADDVRSAPPPVLRVYRKTTQTLVFWQEEAAVYVLASTLPGERTIALARRLATAGEDGR